MHTCPLGSSLYPSRVRQGPVQSRATTPLSEQSRCDVKNIGHFRGSNYYVEMKEDSKEHSEGESQGRKEGSGREESLPKGVGTETVLEIVLSQLSRRQRHVLG